jgi:hypothetical protein
VRQLEVENELRDEKLEVKAKSVWGGNYFKFIIEGGEG